MTRDARIDDALAIADSPAWTGVAYGRSECFWWTGGATGARRRTSAGFEDVQWDDVYEIRAFDGSRELRWWQEDLEVGSMAVVDVPTGPDRGPDERWLLWGRAAGAPETDDVSGRAWTPLAEARIGTVWTPAGLSENGSASIVVVPVLSTSGPGNVSISDEVLTGIVPTQEGAI